MPKLTSNIYQFQAREFDPDTKAHIEQHRRQSLARQPSTLTPLAVTLERVIKDLAQTRQDRKAA